MVNPAIRQYLYGEYTNDIDLIGNPSVTRAYAYSNENLKQYINLLNIAGGRVATVGSSGDQAFYAVYKDASEVTIVDANPYARPIIELKMSAIKNMDLDEFLDFWSEDGLIDAHIVRKLTQDIKDEDSCNFIKYILNKMSVSGRKSVLREVIDIGSFTSDYGRYGAKASFSKGCEFYRDDSAYSVLKEKLSKANLSFKMAKYSSFPHVLTGRYSTIMLSNIFDYFLDNSKFFDTASDLIRDSLLDGGTIQMYYDLGNYMQFNKNMAEELPNIKPCKMYMIEDSTFGELKERKKGAKYPSQEIDEPTFISHDEDMVYIYEK